MRCNAIVLSDGLIHQLIKTIGADKVETLLELGVKTTAETILLLGITVCMMTSILAQVIENLCITVLFASEHGTGNKANFDSMVRSHASASTGSSVLWNSGAGYQEILISRCRGNMMCPEGGPEFILKDYMVSR